MRFKNILIISILFLFHKPGSAGTFNTIESHSIWLTDTACFTTVGACEAQNRPSPLLHLLRARVTKNKKSVAAILAFPFPFGIVALHRIYLGCPPYIPIVYIATLGGFFILPFIDFCALVATKNLDRYTNNKKIFMWAN